LQGGKLKNNSILTGTILIIILFIILSACHSQECTKPMVKIGNKCCVDLNNNQICDLEENNQTQNKITGQNTAETEPKEKPAVTVKTKPKTSPKPETTKQQEKTAAPEPETEAEATQESEDKMVKIEKPLQKKDLPETHNFIGKYEAMSNGYKYIYNSAWHKVKDTKVKIELKTPKKYHSIETNNKKYPVFYIDTIYIDRDKKTATGYCEKYRECFSEELLDTPLRLDYSEFKDKTPDEWLYEYADTKPDLFEERKYYVKDKQTSRATYKKEYGELRIYYHPLTGLPVRIETKITSNPMQIQEYFELTAGTVRDVDVKHRSRNEIPPDEVFYSTRY